MNQAVKNYGLELKNMLRLIVLNPTVPSNGSVLRGYRWPWDLVVTRSFPHKMYNNSNFDKNLFEFEIMAKVRFRHFSKTHPIE